jgi:RimJ/RimL family protein N-acetyltransferase
MLHGEKVVLRVLNRADLPRIWQFNNDLEVELAGGGDPPMPQSLERLQAEFDQQAARGGRDNADFAIEADGIVIGNCGLRDFSEAHRTCELGISIGDKDYWGKGYGRDAVRLLVQYAFQYRNMRKVFLRVWGNNERGIRSYRAVGFIEEGRLRQHVWSDGGYHDLVYMGLLRHEWDAP